MQQLVFGVLAFTIGVAVMWRPSRLRFRGAGGLLAAGGVAFALWNHPARAQLAYGRGRLDYLCSEDAYIVHQWSVPVSERYDYKFSRDLLDKVAFQSSQALVLHDTLGPILRRCVAVWTGDCQSWLDALAIPEDDTNPFVVPPGRARTAAALQDALRTHACPKYTPMNAQQQGS